MISKNVDVAKGELHVQNIVGKGANVKRGDLKVDCAKFKLVKMDL